MTCLSRQPRAKLAAGISLLEVVLALAILSVASAYLASAMRQATTNALKAQNLTQAELVAESVMSQLVAGLIPAQSATWTPYFNSRGQTEWMYQLTEVPTELEGMLGYQVAVQRVDPNMGLVQAKMDLFTNRWIIDPELGLDTPPETDYGDESYGSESTSSSSSGFGAGGPGT